MILTTYPQSRYIAPRHNVKAFTFTRKTFVAELSDFNGRDVDGQLYDDAADRGFVLENHETNRAVPFVWSNVLRDAEQELQVVIYTVCPEAVRKDARLEGLEVHLLND